jgi:hypothetical protein
MQEIDSETDYTEIAMKLAKQAEALAIGKLTKDRIKDSIETLEGMKEKELSQAIAVLRAIKDAYEEACRQIDKQVDELLYDTFGTIKFPKLNVSINWSKVERMKRNCLAWDKVSEVIREAIPPQNIDKIKQASNVSKISEYKSLVNFVLSKISNSYKSRIAYINYWKTPELTTSSSSSSSSSRTTISSSTSSSQSDFEFAPNAWWILGLLGLIIGAMAGEVGGAVVGAVIGVGIGLTINNRKKI